MYIKYLILVVLALPSVAFSGVWSGKTNIRMLYPNSTALTFMSDYRYRTPAYSQ